MSHRVNVVNSALSIGLIAAMACSTPDQPTAPVDPPAAAALVPGGATAQQDLAAARNATAHLRRFENAAPAGWSVPVTACKENPPEGGMGYHYGNIGYYLDGLVDPRKPEILLYEPQPSGGLRLVALEYAVPFFTWPSDTPPRLFGRDLKHVADQGEWQLHVWIWKHNPSGIFSDWNPTVDCEHDG